MQKVVLMEAQTRGIEEENAALEIIGGLRTAVLMK